jgi:transposase
MKREAYPTDLSEGEWDILEPLIPPQPKQEAVTGK